MKVTFRNAPVGEECIEILSVDLLNENRLLVEELKKSAASYGLEFGWHYLLDLVWMLKTLGAVEGKRLLDAGAGVGVIQWWLAEHGAEVISVDRGSRAALPLRFRRRVQVEGLRTSDLMPARAVIGHELQQVKERSKEGILAAQARILGREARNRLAALFAPGKNAPQWGKVLIYNQDLANLVDIPTDSLDGIVAVSALEHNSPDGLQSVVAELMRVLKPGAPLLATLGAARDQDWWHGPSSGWCYSEASLRQYFDLPQARSNYDEYDRLMRALRECAELRDNLAGFYFQSGENGMPWGVWDPQYQSVGVCKIKA
jgi:SAM-dependent methyltransferase